MDSIADKPVKTVCVGRFLVDLPRDIVVSFGRTDIAGWSIVTLDHLPEAQFASVVAERENTLRTQKNEREQVSLEAALSFDYPDAQGRIFVFGRYWGDYFMSGQRIDFQVVSIEAWVRLRGATFRFEVQSAQPADAETLRLFLRQLRFRENHEIPDEPGFCLDNAFIRDPIPTDHGTESTVVFAGYYERPDLAIVVSTAAHITQYKTLLQRNADNDVMQRYASRFHTTFAGRREINGIRGEEVAYWVREHNGTKGHSYMWESDTTKGDPMRPCLSLELGTGYGPPGDKPVNSSLSDGEVQRLWDRISASIRARPVKVPAAEPTPPADRAQAGTPCPASGWWSCGGQADGHAVLGGTTQYFERGVRMPQAELLGPLTMFDRLKRQQPTFTRAEPTVWVLKKART